MDLWRLTILLASFLFAFYVFAYQTKLGGRSIHSRLVGRAPSVALYTFNLVGVVQGRHSHVPNEVCLTEGLNPRLGEAASPYDPQMRPPVPGRIAEPVRHRHRWQILLGVFFSDISPVQPSAENDGNSRQISSGFTEHCSSRGSAKRQHQGEVPTLQKVPSIEDILLFV